MNHIKLFEELFPYRHKLTDEEFQKVWDYFCNHVFPKERVEIMNKIILDTIQEVEFLDFTDNIVGGNVRLYPYFGLKGSKESGSYTGLSYDFQKEINNGTYNLQTCKGWDHLFRDAFNTIQPHSSFGKIEHGIPYYEYDFNLGIVDSWDNKSVDDMKKMLDKDLLGDSWNDITKYITMTAKRFAVYYNLDLSISTKTYGNRGVFRKNSYKFEIRIEDFDFEPKEI